MDSYIRILAGFNSEIIKPGIILGYKVLKTSRVLILGGGSAGLVAGLALSEEKDKCNMNFEISIVNKDKWHYMPPLWVDVALNGLPVESTRAPLANVAKY
jgi:sulfide:quinone oxidoreductase